jgi:hypothetical protein
MRKTAQLWRKIPKIAQKWEKTTDDIPKNTGEFS